MKWVLKQSQRERENEEVVERATGMEIVEILSRNAVSVYFLVIFS